MQKVFYLGRSKILFALFVAWSAILVYRLFELSVIERDRFLEEGRKLAFRRVTIPAARGKIFDSNGVQLAWIERCYDIALRDDSSLGGRKRERILQMLQEIISEDPAMRDKVFAEPGRGITVRNLSPESMDRIRERMGDMGSFVIGTRIERRYVDYGEVKEMLGAVRISADGKMEGATGIEKEQDEALSGTDGQYSVMIDRNGNIIRGTLEVEREMVPGKDITLQTSLGEILGK